MERPKIEDYKTDNAIYFAEASFIIKRYSELQDLYINHLEAINYTRCSTQLPDELEPVLAKIEHINSLGKSNWYEVVYNDGNWCSYQGSKTFEDGEKVVKWNYCKAIV